MHGGRGQISGNGVARWRFASALFDRTERRLIIDGRPVEIEAKPLAVLGVLLERSGEIVTKSELLDAVWPEVTVVEASLTTAVLKLRRALGDGKGEGRIIETIPRVGYRLAVPVEVDSVTPAAARGPAHPASAVDGMRRRRLAAGGLALAAVLGAGSLLAAKWPWGTQTAFATAKPAVTQDDVRDALRKLDVERIEQLLRLGWNPTTPFDKEGNDAVDIALLVCEWNPVHDRERLVLVVRTLFDAGAKLDHRNVWGDTPYSIAKAPRYCGPEHPVTKMMQAMCYNGYKPLGDKCLASYELAGE